MGFDRGDLDRGVSVAQAGDPYAAWCLGVQVAMRSEIADPCVSTSSSSNSGTLVSCFSFASGS